MSPEFKNKPIFNPSGHVTLEAMNRYYASSFDDAEKRDFDDHISDCEFCRDALEGLELISDKTKLDAIVAEINHNLKKNLSEKHTAVKPLFSKPGLKYLFYAAAASVIFFIAFFIFIKNYSGVKDAEITTLAPGEYEIHIPDVPLPKFRDQTEKPGKSEKVNEELSENSDATEETTSVQQKMTGSGEKKADFKAVTDELKNNKNFITEKLSEKDDISGDSGLHRSEPERSAIASNQPVEYYLGGVIIEAENPDAVISGLVLSQEANQEITENFKTRPARVRDKSKSKESGKMENPAKASGDAVPSAGDESVSIQEQSAGNSVHFFRTLDTMPEFPGGNDAMQKYLSDHIQYPQSAQMQGIQGKISLSFIVEESGKITAVQIEKGLEKECNESALAAIRSMPDWNPGYYEGKPVRVKLNLPVIFQLK